ncbi:MAG: PAC2 family protein [Streptosporangiales bacterium]|nr:PAC2 family protein [Streptosporangiales bacterium]MBO0890818.1 PAC2 family protein [Acidothermales bacterium]
MIELEDTLPALVRPTVIAAFEGWNDAADSATGVVEHLEEVWKAQPFAALDPEDYYDFQVNRPQVALDDEGVTSSISWPSTRLSFARPPLAPGDVVLVRGIEPSMRWRTFCRDILDLATRLGATTVVTLGALLADAPHTRPVPVTGITSNEELQASLSLEPSRYEGPTGIVGVLQSAATDHGLRAVSFWAAVPHYVAQPPCPKATLALLQRVEDLVDATVPMGDLPEQAKAWQRGVDELAREDAEVREYVESLEQERDTVDLPEASGEAIAKEFERYLKRRQRGDGPPGPGTVGPTGPTGPV